MATATLALTRKGRFFDRKHEWQIIIDGKSAGSIADDQAVRLPVGAGRHTLRLRSSGRFTSPERSLAAADGEVVRFTCHGPLIWPQAAVAVVVPSLWIGLKQE